MSSPINYNPNCPQRTTDSYATTQPQLQANFQVLYNAFMMNHVALDSSTNVGTHNVIQLYEQSNEQQTGTTQISVYTKDVEGQTDQLFMRYPTNGTEFQLTNYQIYSPGPNAFFSFLPGGILIYFGISTNGQNTIYLTPNVTKNVMGMSLSPNLTGVSKPTVTLIQNEEGYYTQVNMNYLGNTPNTRYTILGNL